MSNPTLPDERFQTHAVLLASTRGMGENGFADMIFITPENQLNYVTNFGPVGLAGLLQNIKDILSGLGEVPQHMPLPGTALEGKIPEAKNTKEYFGQTYDTDVLQLLGVLVMRANLLDQGLIELDCAVAKMPLAQAEARYHASTNMKARLDIIRASIGASDLPEAIRTGAIDALDKVKGVVDRRNTLIHSHWTFRNGKHRAQSARPNTTKPLVEITVTMKNLLTLAEDYYTVSLLLHAVTQTISQSAAASTASTPSSTDAAES